MKKFPRGFVMLFADPKKKSVQSDAEILADLGFVVSYPPLTSGLIRRAKKFHKRPKQR